MTLAGHSDSRTTKLYTHLAGEMFRPEAERIGSFLWGSVESGGANPEPIEDRQYAQPQRGGRNG